LPKIFEGRRLRIFSGKPFELGGIIQIKTGNKKIINFYLCGHIFNSLSIISKYIDTYNCFVKSGFDNWTMEYSECFLKPRLLIQISIIEKLFLNFLEKGRLQICWNI